MAEERYEYQADTGSVSVTTSFSDDPNQRIAYLEARVGELHELIGKLRGEREAERSSRQAWAEEALRLQHLVEQIIADLREKHLEQRALTDKSPSIVGFTAGLAEALTWVQWLARPQEGALDSSRSFCACTPDAEAAALVEAGFARPQCTVHPDGGAA